MPVILFSWFAKTFGLNLTPSPHPFLSPPSGPSLSLANDAPLKCDKKKNRQTNLVKNYSWLMTVQRYLLLQQFVDKRQAPIKRLV